MSNWNIQILKRAFPSFYEWNLCRKKQQLQFCGGVTSQKDEIDSQIDSQLSEMWQLNNFFLGSKLWDILPKEIKGS